MIEKKRDNVTHCKAIDTHATQTDGEAWYKKPFNYEKTVATYITYTSYSVRTLNILAQTNSERNTYLKFRWEFRFFFRIDGRASLQFLLETFSL